MTELTEQKTLTVVKVGTNSLLKNERPTTAFETVAEGVEELSRTGNVILITSAAIGFGVLQQRLEKRPEEVSKKQALSTIGQFLLMQEWQKAFKDRPVAQILLTARELQLRKEVESFKATLIALWAMGGIPIVNENDAITSEEIKNTFSDNDRLAALVAEVTDADGLMLLTDTDGVQVDFRTPQARTLARVSVDEAMKHVIDTRDTAEAKNSQGDMMSKVLAAGQVVKLGKKAHIGNANDPISDILAGKSGTEIVQ